MGPRRLGALSQWHVVQPTAVHPGSGLACSCGRRPGAWMVWKNGVQQGATQTSPQSAPTGW
eukprot:9795624-Alexandrium_andersonii.AAC.1